MMSHSIPQLMLLFFAYAFLGWCAEVAFAACCEGRFVNRGFLNGPVCPIYGFGVLGVVLLLEPYGDSLPLLFAGSFIVTTAIEFFTGLVLEKIFHAKWWDYSQNRFNIMGYVCLTFSLMWGVLCLAVVQLLHPLMSVLVDMIPYGLMLILLGIFIVSMAVDIAATLAAIRKLNERLKLLSEIASEMHTLSDGIGKVVSGGTLAAKNTAMAGEAKVTQGMRRLGEVKSETQQRIGEGKRAVTEKLDHGREAVSEVLDQSRQAMSDRLIQGKDAGKRRLMQLRERFANLMEEHSFGQNRLLNAFPHLTSIGYQEMLSAIRDYAKQHKKK